MICESVNSDQEEKGGDVLNGNRIINVKNLITNIDNVLVCKERAQEREPQIKLEEERDNFLIPPRSYLGTHVLLFLLLYFCRVTLPEGLGIKDHLNDPHCSFHR